MYYPELLELGTGTCKASASSMLREGDWSHVQDTTITIGVRVVNGELKMRFFIPRTSKILENMIFYKEVFKRYTCMYISLKVVNHLK